MRTISNLVLTAIAIVLVLPSAASAFTTEQLQGAPFSVDTPMGLEHADVNNDGFEDLVTLPSPQPGQIGSVTSYFGTPSGTLTRSGFAWIWSAGVTDFAIGNLDSDGLPDIAFTYPGHVTAYFGRPDGQFQLTTQHSIFAPDLAVGDTRDIAIADINADGAGDIVVATAHGVAVELGNWAGGFSPLTGDPRFGGAATEISVADVNGDSHPDIVAVDASTGDLHALLGSASGRLTVADGGPDHVGGGPLVTGDFNGDGIDDVAVADSHAPTVSVLIGDGHGGFGSPIQIDAGTGDGPSALAAGDLDGDGTLDLAATDARDNTVSVLIGDGAGHFTAAPNGPVDSGGNDPAALAITDIDHDGTSDLAVLNEGSGSDLNVLLNRSRAALEPAPSAVDFGDVRTGSASASKDVAITNAGDYTTTINRVVVRGAGSSEFLASDGCTDVRLAPGRSCTVHVRFAPLTDGSRGATLEARTYDTAPLSIPLSGTGDPAPVPDPAPLADPDPAPVSGPAPDPATDPNPQPMPQHLEAGVRVRGRSAQVRFTAGQAAGRFECSLDGRRFRECQSPQRYANLKPGRHSVSIQALAESGDVSATATRRFRVRIAR